MVLLLLSLCFFCIFLHYRFNFDVFLFRPERFRHNNDDGNYINKTFFSAYIPRLNQNSIQFIYWLLITWAIIIVIRETMTNLFFFHSWSIDQKKNHFFFLLLNVLTAKMMTMMKRVKSNFQWKFNWMNSIRVCMWVWITLDLAYNWFFFCHLFIFLLIC